MGDSTCEQKKKKQWLIPAWIDASEVKKQLCFKLPDVRVAGKTRVGLFIKDHSRSDKFRFEWA